MIRFITTTLALAVMLGLAGSAGAAAITVANHSFEADDLIDGHDSGALPTGWSKSGGAAVGYLDRNSGAYSTAILPTPDNTDGEQLAWSNFGGFYQVLSDVLEADTTYTLTVDVGDRNNTGFPGAVLRLGSGVTFASNLLAPTVVSNTTPDANWETWQTTFTTGAAPAGLDDPLRVELVDLGGVQVLFDNVRLNAVPEPATLGMLVIGGVGVLLRRKRM